jgi:hypothetical protein
MEGNTHAVLDEVEAFGAAILNSHRVMQRSHAIDLDVECARNLEADALD